MKSLSLRTVVYRLNSGSSAYSGSSVRRQVVGCAGRSVSIEGVNDVRRRRTFEVCGVLEGHFGVDELCERAWCGRATMVKQLREEYCAWEEMRCRRKVDACHSSRRMTLAGVAHSPI